MAQNKVYSCSNLEELISFSKEKIFLEPIDQYFEEESNSEDNNQEGEIYLKKLDDELSKCLLLDNNDDISTSMESDDLNSKKSSQAVKKIKLSDILYIDKESINKTRNDIMNKYYWIIQNKNHTEQK